MNTHIGGHGILLLVSHLSIRRLRLGLVVAESHEVSTDAGARVLQTNTGTCVTTAFPHVSH